VHHLERRGWFVESKPNTLSSTMTDSPLKSSFAPVVDGDTRVLILGSLPGEASLRLGQYYGNPRNQFWRLVAAVTQAPMPEAYEDRLAALRGAGIGLWDVVKTASRAGSLDSAIRGHQANPLAELIAGLPRLQAVAFNGGTASKIGRLALGQTPAPTLLTLPSSSPALTLSFERKLAAWSELRAFL
ncbi:MAG: DNA-deoxyinosine glycosylase, partial [Caulobacteraceae bacterium]|nr:DNA-deoxyinosine glycosylase [Caulobacteraceae bacterium]